MACAAINANAASGRQVTGLCNMPIFPRAEQTVWNLSAMPRWHGKKHSITKRH